MNVSAVQINNHWSLKQTACEATPRIFLLQPGIKPFNKFTWNRPFCFPWAVADLPDHLVNHQLPYWHKAQSVQKAFKVRTEVLISLPGQEQAVPGLYRGGVSAK